jgi:tRNA 2-selenouridine synthase
MSAAPAAVIDSPAGVRAARIVHDYADIAADPAALDAALVRLPRHISKETVSDWRALAAAGEIEVLVAALIVDHYDPAYRRSGLTGDRAAGAAIRIDAPDDAALEQAADQVLKRMAAISAA